MKKIIVDVLISSQFVIYVHVILTKYFHQWLRLFSLVSKINYSS